MRIPAYFKGLKNSQRVQVQFVVSGVTIHSSVKEVVSNIVGTYGNAAQYALGLLGNARLKAKEVGDPIPCGLNVDAYGHKVQVDIL